MKVLSSNLMPSQIKDLRDKELMKACREFESVFNHELLKSMRRTVEKCDIFYGGEGEEIYQSLLDQEYAKKMSGSGINSLAESLFQQLKERAFIRSVEPLPSPPACLADTTAPEWPLKPLITSKFGPRKDPFTGKSRFHSGIDIAAMEGTHIKASLPGKVTHSGYSEGYGNVIILDHGNGFSTLYAHNSRNLVKPGDWVEKGASIAMVGSSGRSTGPHLHFEVRRDGKKLDPLEFLG
ncbi:MAG: peptidoglycan DD-metalloendopeptidase family protein [Deltaproteobacteria bacterium]|nr:peptidoglycan DD-metalloendopeptidase family protein [Deltaproteobacteria bacterium]